MRLLRILVIGFAVGVLTLVLGCAALPYALHALNPDVTYRIPNAGKTLFITLDDSPSAATPLILDVLRKHGAQATFFVITDHIQPEVMRRIVTEGHRIGHHMKTTAKISKMGQRQFEREFLEAEKALAEYPNAKLFRPPDGSITKAQAAFVLAQGYSIVVGTVFPLDHWLESESKIEILAKVLAIDGGIVILHDTAARGRRTAAVLDELLPDFKAKGYQFAQLPQTVVAPQ